jgi:hypothetical protein
MSGRPAQAGDYWLIAFEMGAQSTPPESSADLRIVIAPTMKRWLHDIAQDPSFSLRGRWKLFKTPFPSDGDLPMNESDIEILLGGGGFNANEWDMAIVDLDEVARAIS